MMIVGLTGGIGSGKTTVAKMFEEEGVPVYNSDEQAKKLMQSSKKMKKAIIDLLGKDAYRKNQLNRDYIASKVFADNELLKQLNVIVHPKVGRHFLSWAKKQRAPYVIQEAAIIFEKSLQDRYDKIILVTAPLDLRIDRLMKRDNSSRESILDKMKNQWDDPKKMSLADFVIENIDLNKTRSIIKEIHDNLLAFNR